MSGFQTQWVLIGQGLLTTLWLSFCVWVVSVCIGFLLATIRFFRVPGLHVIIANWVYGIRSIPIVMLIALIHFGILPVLGVNNHLFLSAFLGLGISVSVYFTEVFRGGFASLHTGELESAASLGLTDIQQWRYVILPLVMLRTLPAVMNQTVSLIKDTALASVIGLMELSRSAEMIYQVTLHPLPWLALTGALYFIVCFALSYAARRLAVAPVAAL